MTAPPSPALPAKPTVVISPEPRRNHEIFSPQVWAELTTAFDVVDLQGRPDELDQHLAQAFAIVGQPDLPASRLDSAPGLKAILNVEGNFYPNVDYPRCFERGIHVLGCGPVYAVPVAEFALGLALDLARGISRQDRAFRAGRESYVGADNADAITLTGARIGVIGFGNLGRALLPLLTPFRATVRAYDPWLPDGVLAQAGAIPTGLDEVLSTSDVVFVLATVTADSEHLIGARELALLADGARLVLVSRAAVVDFEALLEHVGAGRIQAAVDVWPDEPMPADYPGRGLEGLVLSPHRAGGIPSAFLEIGRLVVDDLTLIARGLPPVRMQAAARELVGRYRNRPVATPKD
ncbi:hydroxyacid dehydrogenase [Jatrophihabitans telluris]|uniref:Hydroxyacid dehydrogenase n=1 Tax=Jatrophihabitans telluris TaxID=2038343 RepID=A0ABY4R0G6_9ACTN|nr:hydroxyacid dehydrogenase [Jatrophihabitans telluris]UQX88621.1 hydroxyacid dehydrogenase [Jatrophihabitans telluris]